VYSGDSEKLLALPSLILGQMPLAWTFILLLMRHFTMLTVAPGIGSGLSGAVVRFPAMALLSFAALCGGARTELPAHLGEMVICLGSEALFGLAIGIIPLMMISGAQMAGYYASATMGLNAGQLFDPTSGSSTSEISKLLSDITTLIFLSLGGHHIMILAASGSASDMIPGTFMANLTTFDILVSRASRIFEMAALLSSPIVVALLLTQFVMGLISKVVPSVNVFVVSFPITVGVGLMLLAMLIPVMKKFVEHESRGVDAAIHDVIRIK